MSDVKVPDLGENIDTAEIIRVLVAEGDQVDREQPVLEVETDKATFEVPSSEAGRVTKVHVKEGDSIAVGQTILTVGEAGAEAAATEPAGTAEAAPKESGAQAREDLEAERALAEAESETGQTEADEVEKVVDEPVARRGEAPQRARARAEAESDRQDGERARQAARAEAGRNGHAARRAAHEPSPAPEPDEARAGRRPVPAAPATRRLARELGVDLEQIQPSQVDGRITREDVKEHVRNRGAGGGRAPAPQVPDFERWGEVEHKRMSKLGRTGASRLSTAWLTIPHVTQHDLVDITALEEARRRYEATRRPTEPKLTVTVLAIKAVIAALKAFPEFNSSFDEGNGELIYKRYYNIGVAVDTEHGLLVPVVHDADRRTTRELAEAVDDLARRARERKLSSEEMQGGTFSITNLGGIGGTAFTPIVNYPEVAILGMSRARREYVPSDEGPLDRTVMPVSLSYDHRVVNGADAARFTRYLARLLEDPLHLLMEV